MEDLTKPPAIDKDLAGKIEEIIKIEQAHEMPGLGSKRVHILHKTSEIEDMEDLKRVANDGDIRMIEGFGKKMDQGNH